MVSMEVNVGLPPNVLSEYLQFTLPICTNLIFKTSETKVCFCLYEAYNRQEVIMNTNQTRAILFMLLSTFFLSLNGLIAKVLSDQLSFDILSFLRLLVPSLILFWMLLLTRWQFPTLQMWRFLIIRSFCISGYQLSFIYGMLHFSLVETVVLFSTAPLFIPLIEKLFFHTKIKKGLLFNLALTFIGVLIMTGGERHFVFHPELLLGLLAGLFGAGSQVSEYQLSKESISPVGLNAWCYFVSALFVIPVIAINHDWINIVHTTLLLNDLNNHIVLLLMVLAFSIITTQVFQVRAYELSTSASQLAPIIFTNLLLSAIWQVMFFDSPMMLHKIIGMLIVVFATINNAVNLPLKHWLKIRI